MAGKVLSLLLVALALSCGRAGVQPTHARVQADASLELGRAYVGESAQGAFAVTAAGTGPVAVLRVWTAHPELTLQVEGDRIAAGGVLAVRVLWAPRAAGALEASVEVETDVEGSERLAVPVRGEARALPACDDGNACTDDRFERSAERCVHSFHTRGCDDGNACTAEDRCHDGTCRGLARRCDDDNVCTLDLCDPAAGCVHPPDARTCDDKDPCTADVCDPDDGCTHPDAPDGTACGAFSCAQAHLCVFGRCRELNMTGISDGLPCFDGDLCTEDDTCQAGRCAPGLRVRRDPEIVASFETFGGAGSLPATDGFRYLFADPDALRVAVREGTGLRHTATLPLATSVAPVALRPARFLAVQTGRLAVVDVSDPAAPAFVRADAVLDPQIPVQIRQVARLDGGVVVAALPLVPSATAQSEVLAYVPYGADDAPGAAVVLGSAGSVQDLAADGTRLAWTDERGAHWMELQLRPGVAPRVLHAAELGAAQRVAVSGTGVALVNGDVVELYEVAAPAAAAPVPCPSDAPDLPCRMLEPACNGPQFAPGAFVSCEGRSDGLQDCPAGARCATLTVVAQGSPCPDCDDCCCPGGPLPVCVWERAPRRLASLLVPGVLDVALEGTTIFTAEPSGIHSWAPDVVPTLGPASVVRARLDPLPATRLDLAAGHVLASGPLALPLARPGALAAPEGAGGEQVLPEPLQRLTGERHGDLVAAADDEAPRVVLAGRAVVASYDLLAQRIVSWTLTPTVSGPERPRVLRGRTHDAAVDTEVREPYVPVDAGTDAGPECTGVPLLVTDRTGAETQRLLCGLHDGTLDVSSGRVWGDTATAPASPYRCVAADDRMLRVWSLDPLAPPEPVFERSYGPGTPAMPWRVRASDRGAQAALLLQQPNVADDGVEVWDAQSATLLGTARLPATSILRGWRRDALALEGARMLVGREGGVDLYDAGSTSVVPRAQLTLPAADPNRVARVPWMAGGRAWVAATAADGILPAEVLYQVEYDAAGALSVAGAVDTGSSAARVYDNGLVAIVTRPSGVAVVRPACR